MPQALFFPPKRCFPKCQAFSARGILPQALFFSPKKALLKKSSFVVPEVSCRRRFSFRPQRCILKNTWNIYIYIYISKLAPNTCSGVFGCSRTQCSRTHWPPNTVFANTVFGTRTHVFGTVFGAGSHVSDIIVFVDRPRWKCSYFFRAIQHSSTLGN